MPEPFVYLQAMASAAISATFVLMAATMRRAVGSSRLTSAYVLAVTFGLAVGYYVMGFRLVWPPVKGLDRFLILVLPVVLGIEFIAGSQSGHRWRAWLLRLTLAAALPLILLHGSVYLLESDIGWSQWQAGTLVGLCGGLLSGVWGLLSWLSKRTPGLSIPLSLCLSIQCAGLTVMMAGYLKGGAAAFPLAAALSATTVVAGMISKRAGASTEFDASAAVGIGVVGLFGVLFIGRFFGGLSTDQALAILLAPLLCWLTELSLLRRRRPWIVGSVRLGLVAVPLLVVMVRAKRDFDRDMGPLLRQSQIGISSVADCRNDLAIAAQRRRVWQTKVNAPSTKSKLAPGSGTADATESFDLPKFDESTRKSANATSPLQSASPSP